MTKLSKKNIEEIFSGILTDDISYEDFYNSFPFEWTVVTLLKQLFYLVRLFMILIDDFDD